MKLLRINNADNVAVALSTIAADETELGVTALADIPAGHKLALADIKKGGHIIKYGCAIGEASRDIKRGEHVHTQNVKTLLDQNAGYTYAPDYAELEKRPEAYFEGFLRSDGRAGTRNELWIIPTVGCVNSVAQKIVADNQKLVRGSVEGLYAFTHPFGCSQMGSDHETTKKLLAALALHPNAGGVLMLGLGCENNTMAGFKQALGEYDAERIRFLVCQEVADEYAEAARLLGELAEYAGGCKRQRLSANLLVVGMKCGGSDGLSGLTANPAVGAFSDRLISSGGSTVLTEAPEMFGAESILLRRCRNERVFTLAADMLRGFKEYYASHDQVVYENPSPGNKEGGITTLEDKSCGCVQKGGSAVIEDVIPYGGRVKARGLTLLSGPGNDLISSTALTAAGAQVILFTTGRGTPFGAPAPTLKISTNTPLYEKKRGWIDFDAGVITSGATVAECGEKLFELVLETASGKQTKCEENGFREIAIFKDGVVL